MKQYRKYFLKDKFQTDCFKDWVSFEKRSRSHASSQLKGCWIVVSNDLRNHELLHMAPLLMNCLSVPYTTFTFPFYFNPSSECIPASRSAPRMHFYSGSLPPWPASSRQLHLVCSPPLSTLPRSTVLLKWLYLELTRNKLTSTTRNLH